MSTKRRILKVVGLEDFDNGIVQEINETEIAQNDELATDIEKEQSVLAEEIQSVEDLSAVEAEMGEAVEQGEANIAAMNNEPIPTTETEVVNEDGSVDVVTEQVEPNLNADSPDEAVAAETMELEKSMEAWAGAFAGARLQTLYNHLSINRQAFSFESMVKNPRHTYVASVEGVKDMAKAAGQAILNFIKTIWEKLKKLFGQVITFCSGLEKRFVALKKEAEAINLSEVQFGTDEKVKEALKKLSPAAGINFEAYFDGSKQIVDAIKGLAVKSAAGGEELETLKKVLSNQSKGWFKVGQKEIQDGMCVYALTKGEAQGGGSADFATAMVAELSASDGSIKMDMKEVSVSFNALSTPKEVHELMLDSIDSGIKICRGMKAFKDGVDKCLDEMMKSAKDAKVEKKSIKPLANIINRVAYQVSKVPSTLFGVASSSKKLLSGKPAENKEESK